MALRLPGNTLLFGGRQMLQAGVQKGQAAFTLGQQSIDCTRWLYMGSCPSMTFPGQALTDITPEPTPQLYPPLTHQSTLKFHCRSALTAAGRGNRRSAVRLCGQRHRLHSHSRAVQPDRGDRRKCSRDPRVLPHLPGDLRPLQELRVRREVQVLGRLPAVSADHAGHCAHG